MKKETMINRIDRLIVVECNNQELSKHVINELIEDNDYNHLELMKMSRYESIFHTGDLNPDTDLILVEDADYGLVASELLKACRNPAFRIPAGNKIHICPHIFFFTPYLEPDEIENISNLLSKCELSYKPVVLLISIPDVPVISNAFPDVYRKEMAHANKEDFMNKISNQPEI